MKPFTAWLAMDDGANREYEYSTVDGIAYGVSAQVPRLQMRNESYLHVLIVADTPENRKKLGMEESCRS